MKNILVLILSFFLFLGNASAQRSDRSMMRIRLSDGTPLLLTINGRDFKKTGRSITIADIPRKRQDLQIYRFRPYADGRGGKAELVFSGRVKINKGSTYDCVVDVRERRFMMQEVGSLPPLDNRPPFNQRRDQPIGSNANNDDAPYTADNAEQGSDLGMPPSEQVSSRLQTLKTAMDRVDADSKKLAEARKFIEQNSVTAAEVSSIAGWIFFDDNRLTFVKQAYAKVSDKANFKSEVGTVFTLASSQQEFDDFMKGR
ncbi:DUF4476 domain-containing protein [Taibaiella chishuiensis]|uniref:Uncharacterized protein DUF4476 n=1 Tax=Taibaiella chishuiensis TaxID=1434707 RepID=A0A2P8DBC4_9BACT|nr:DUF4476 domain-containing protein [Taibaiella chishuiensis]PSK94526.1 uncharacterized protein DUF4476 [Taibaiella chishuiensis]